jgi:hypothetical protein
MMSETGAMEGTLLSEGVSLLIQRMRSHPKEFDMEHGKWSDVLISVYHRTHATGNATAVIGVPPDAWMSPSEAEAIWHEYVQLKQKRFHSWVMETLLTGETEEDKSGSVYKTVPHPIRKGSWQTIAAQISDTPLTPLAQKLRDKINKI